jgi:excisionase family DNA binding protein
MSNDFTEEYVTIAEAAERYKVNKAYWYDQINEGKIAAYELPGKRGMYLKLTDLAEFWQPKQVKRDDRPA